MKKILAFLVLLAAALWGGCGGGGGGGFSGTVTAPAGASVQGTVVLACFYLEASDDCDSQKSKEVTLNTAGRTASFSIEGLAAGDYL
ncbi:MAG: carboxypeptidase-like regulatory domain-containing protein, partial [Meiothermus sp.]|uniref:hypothetical protein n=1 Tax=Meiothermus sp. TaxID=1955249 RepID=UPI0025CCBCF9